MVVTSPARGASLSSTALLGLAGEIDADALAAVLVAVTQQPTPLHATAPPA